MTLLSLCHINITRSFSGDILVTIEIWMVIKPFTTKQMYHNIWQHPNFYSRSWKRYSFFHPSQDLKVYIILSVFEFIPCLFSLRILYISNVFT